MSSSKTVQAQPSLRRSVRPDIGRRPGRRGRPRRGDRDGPSVGETRPPAGTSSGHHRRHGPRRRRRSTGGRRLAVHATPTCARASTTRQAYYFLRYTLDDPRLQASYAAHVDTFDAAVALMDVAAERVLIPTTAPPSSATSSAPHRPGAPRPTLLLRGYDRRRRPATCRSSTPSPAATSPLALEGPGQGEALYRQRLYLRPDYEHLLPVMVDGVGQPKDGRGAARARRAPCSPASGAAPPSSTASGAGPRPAQPDMGHRLPPPSVARVVGTVLAATRLSADRAEFSGPAPRHTGDERECLRTSRTCRARRARQGSRDPVPDPARRVRERPGRRRSMASLPA